VRKLLITILVLSLVVDIGIFISTFIVPEVYEPYVCNEGETLETRSHSTSDGTATNLYCVDREGVAKDVTVKFLIPFMAIIFGAPLLIGALVKKTSKSTPSPLAAPVFNQATNRPDKEGDGESLMDKLKSLQQAHTMGLITEKEYEKTKQELLDKLTG
jgi:hypothetical protein